MLCCMNHEHAYRDGFNVTFYASLVLNTKDHVTVISTTTAISVKDNEVVVASDKSVISSVLHGSPSPRGKQLVHMVMLARFLGSVSQESPGPQPLKRCS